MTTEGRADAIIDASVLINFLNVDRCNLFAPQAPHRFLITEHVRKEITEQYPAQLSRLEQAFTNGWLSETRVETLPELDVFAQLTQQGLGLGECAAITAAGIRGVPLAIDDKTARKRATQRFPSIILLDTAGLTVLFIRAGPLTVAEADKHKAEWESLYRFRLVFASFQELL